ncbi:MAG: phosphate ABC transporter substrate-binding protein PstS [Firmicutes bacterium]|nr:phosphate ABC transporter substrate-binding protein PstS [Bacillota bacterium]
MRKKSLPARILTVLVCLGLLVSLLPAAAMAQARRPIAIEFDGRTVASEVQPVIVGTGARARTMVPLRVIFETLGADVSWEAATQTVTGRKAGNVISLVIGNSTATVNGSPQTLDQPAQILGGRTLVPFRFIGEALGARVEWDGARRVVRIASTEASKRRSPLDRELRLTTGGATFPNPLYQRLVHEYARITSPAIRIDYASVGSGAGIRGILGGTFDFAGSDAPLTAEQQAQVRPNEILHVPTVMGAVAVVYNVPGAGTGLRLTGEVLADIFRGVITNWNDTRIATLNPGVRLPDQRITVVRRSDSSGTTFIFTDYLSKVSEAWRTGPGRGTTISWPAAGNIGARGNEGVAAQVGQLPGAVGYVELSTAFLNRLNTVALRNRAGNFVVPTVEATTAAAAAADVGPLDHPTNSPGTDAYPIVGLTWILVHRDQADANKARVIVDFLRWAVVERNLEPFAADLFYAPLPQGVIDRVREQLQSINHNKAPIWR